MEILAKDDAVDFGGLFPTLDDVTPVTIPAFEVGSALAEVVDVAVNDQWYVPAWSTGVVKLPSGLIGTFVVLPVESVIHKNASIAAKARVVTLSARSATIPIIPILKDLKVFILIFKF
jgi:hypothetical protein